MALEKEKIQSEGEIKTVNYEDVRQAELILPENFSWRDLDLKDPQSLLDLYNLL